MKNFHALWQIYSRSFFFFFLLYPSFLPRTPHVDMIGACGRMRPTSDVMPPVRLVDAEEYIANRMREGGEHKGPTAQMAGIHFPGPTLIGKEQLIRPVIAKT